MASGFTPKTKKNQQSNRLIFTNKNNNNRVRNITFTKERYVIQYAKFDFNINAKPDMIDIKIGKLSDSDDYCGKLFSTYTSLYFTKLFKKGGRVASQSFRTYNYNQKEIRLLVKGQFKLDNLIYINQTFFPLSHLLPNFSIRLAKFIQRHVKKSRLFNFFSAEFIVVLKPIKQTAK